MTPAALRRPVAGIAAALTALALVAALAGCGGNDKVEQANAYVEQVNRAQTAFAQTIKRINRQVTADSTATQDRRTLREYVSAVDGVVKRLRAIDPPDSVAALHAKLVGAIDDYGDEVESAVRTLEHPTATSLLDAQQKLLDSTQTVTKQINSTIDRINTRLRS